MLLPSVRVNAASLTPSRARLSRDLGERWSLLLDEEAEEEGGDGSQGAKVEEDGEASREEEEEQKKGVICLMTSRPRRVAPTRGGG